MIREPMSGVHAGRPRKAKRRLVETAASLTLRGGRRVISSPSEWRLETSDRDSQVGLRGLDGHLRQGKPRTGASHKLHCDTFTRRVGGARVIARDAQESPASEPVVLDVVVDDPVDGDSTRSSAGPEHVPRATVA